MSYIPHTEAETRDMLAQVGVADFDALFDAVPSAHRSPALDLPPAMSEMEIAAEMLAISEANDHAGDFAVFRGAGAYHHFSPAAVNHMLLRGEFYTAYTPYQPEISQGTLQAVYEYQSMMCALTGMDAANASHYDGATSLAEAITVALEATRHRRKKVILSHAIHPQYREVARTYHQGRDIRIIGDRGRGELVDLMEMLDSNTAMVAVQYPNFFGQVEDLRQLADTVHASGGLLVVVSNPLALSLFTPPGEFGADIVVGEGQPLGIPLTFGGPYLGYFAIKQRHVRKIAGRIIGESVDADGKRAYVMTLRPREQDIKRERATSNICTNQGLMALAAAVYLSLMGKNGLRQVGELNYHKAHYAAAQIDGLEGYSVDMTKPFFNEFVVACPKPVAEINAALRDQGIIGGYDLAQHYYHLPNHMLLCVTECNAKAEIDRLVDILGGLR